MLTSTEIYDNVEAPVARRPAPGDFGLDLMDAVGAPRAKITKLHAEAAIGSIAGRACSALRCGRSEASPVLDCMCAEEGARP